MLAKQQLEEFQHRGYVVLHGAFDETQTTRMRDRVWRLLRTKGIHPDPSTWPIGDVHRLQAIRNDDANPLHCMPLVDALDHLFGANQWQQKTDWGQALVTFPVSGEWQPNLGPWHLDHAYQSKGLLSGVNVFLFVDNVQPEGGGTLVLDGSPILVRSFLNEHPRYASASHSELNRRVMDCDPWLQLLKADGEEGKSVRRAAMSQSHSVLGHACLMRELTGQAGDIAICHPLLLHAPSMNASNKPRLMRVQRFHRS